MPVGERGRLVRDYDISRVELSIQVVGVYGLENYDDLVNLAMLLELTEAGSEAWPMKVRRV